MKKLCLIVCSDDFERTMASLIIALGSASSGTETHVFFTFWGFNLIRKNNRRVYKGAMLMQRMFGFLNKGGTQNAMLSKYNFGGIGTMMIRKLMKIKGVSSPEEMLKMAKESGVIFHACDMSRDLFGIDPNDFIDGLIDDTIGVASFLDIAKDEDTQCMFL